MKTENTCMHCAELECYARLNCEDNELPTENQEPQDKIENETVTIQVVESKPIAKTVTEK